MSTDLSRGNTSNEMARQGTALVAISINVGTVRYKRGSVRCLALYIHLFKCSRIMQWVRTVNNALYISKPDVLKNCSAEPKGFVESFL
jgi:hypothetical protein